MEIIGIQVAAIAFSIFMLYFAFLCYKRKYFGIASLVFWLIIFSVLIISTLLPNAFYPLVELLKLNRAFDLFMVAGIFFLISISFVNFLQNQKLKRQLEKMVQDKALKDKE
ncbi:DUF2304 domain-containing protein [Candidatus Peregrinibacteria bacterium]|jgi:hypothetical protein|nr:DUF2304 domain-containing protein [Candidatus Peregrinibacteria bacterium]MBT4055838.1 DUF2304 domain-containing protein [Candidatus Peregrinibacteria bacterium]